MGKEEEPCKRAEKKKGRREWKRGTSGWPGVARSTTRGREERSTKRTRRARGNGRSGARPRPTVPGRAGRGEELNRGLGATSEEMVGPKNWRGPGLVAGSARGEAGEDEDADEDADQENEEEEVMEEVEEEVARRGGPASLVVRGGVSRGPSWHRGVGVAAPLAASAPRQRGSARSGGRVTTSPRAARFL